jgi:hypothetical protein
MRPTGVAEVKGWLGQQDTSLYHQGFDSLIYRCDKCLNRHGNYVEKQTAGVRSPTEAGDFFL